MRADAVNRVGASERGAVSVIVAVFALVAMILLAFVIDRGMSYAQRSALQNAADASVLAGAQEFCDGTGADVVAQQYADSNEPDAAFTTLIWANGYWRYINVRGTRTISQPFGGFVGARTAGIGAQATAGKRCPGGGYAIFGDLSLTFNGGITVYGGLYGGSSVTGNGSKNFSYAAPKTDPPQPGPVISGGSIKGFGTASPRTPDGEIIDVRDYADEIGILDRMNLYRNGEVGTPPLDTYTFPAGPCLIDDSFLSAHSTAARVVCPGLATVKVNASWPDHPLKFIEAHSLVIQDKVGAAARPILFYTEGSVDLEPDLDVFGTLYAPNADVVFNGGPHFQSWSYGQILVKSFTMNGTSGGIAIDTTNSEFGAETVRLVQ